VVTGDDKAKMWRRATRFNPHRGELLRAGGGNWRCGGNRSSIMSQIGERDTGD
jgi:cytochrome P450